MVGYEGVGGGGPTYQAALHLEGLDLDGLNGFVQQLLLLVLGRLRGRLQSTRTGSEHPRPPQRPERTQYPDAACNRLLWPGRYRLICPPSTGLQRFYP